LSSTAGRPVAIGGVGGSGTRIVAKALSLLGYFIGDDLNEPLDNLWFTLLFKRRSVLVEPDSRFERLLRLFIGRMSGAIELAPKDLDLIFDLARQDRIQHSSAWLLERAQSFCHGRTAKEPDQPWGWKEPNTHVVIERMRHFERELRYIHLVRHPLEMVTSANQNQPNLWGPIFLDGQAESTPKLALSYWCAAHRRIDNFMSRNPGATLMVDYHRLCSTPEQHLAQIAEFLGAEASESSLQKFRDFVSRPGDVRRFDGIDLGAFDRGDLEYVKKLGYET